jgi:hypothetical protein
MSSSGHPSVPITKRQSETLQEKVTESHESPAKPGIQQICTFKSSTFNRRTYKCWNKFAAEPPA